MPPVLLRAVNPSKPKVRLMNSVANQTWRWWSEWLPCLYLQVPVLKKHIQHKRATSQNSQVRARRHKIGSSAQTNCPSPSLVPRNTIPNFNSSYLRHIELHQSLYHILNQFETIYMQQTMSHSHMLCLLSLYNFAFINNSIATIQSSEILEPTYLSIIICSMIFLILLVLHLNRVIWNHNLDLFNTWASYINNHKKITLIFDNLHKTCSHAWTKLLVL